MEILYTSSRPSSFNALPLVTCLTLCDLNHDSLGRTMHTHGKLAMASSQPIRVPTVRAWPNKDMTSHDRSQRANDDHLLVFVQESSVRTRRISHEQQLHTVVTIITDDAKAPTFKSGRGNRLLRCTSLSP